MNCKLGGTNSELRIALLGDYSAVGLGPMVLRKKVIIAFPLAELSLPEVSPGEAAISGLMRVPAATTGPCLDTGQYSYDHPLSSVWILGQPGRY